MWGNNIAGRPTFGFMKYDGTYRSAQNLAGLAIDRVAKMNMPADRPTDTRVDPSVYGNGLVFAGNLLYSDYMRAHAAGRNEHIAYLVGAIDRLRQIMFDEAITVEFTRQVMRDIASNEAPSAAIISST
jgi:hypothetical protein